MTAAFESPNTPPPLGVEQEADAAIPDKGRLWLEVTVAVAIFLAFCTVILLKATSLMEPDDYAYRAAIASLASGHLELTTAQYKALSTQLGGIQQWTQLPNGKWMSEKNPGYPFYAVWFWWAHALRFAPLFAGGLASTSLFIAARKWLGRWAGTYAVIFFLGSGMAMAFAYRATMPTFTDAAFLAAGAGALLWALLSSEVTLRRRTLSGVLGFVAMEWAVFMRYTDVVVLLAAIAAVLCCWRPARLKGATVAWWLGSVGVFGLGVLIFNWMVYGSPTKTGYANGEITFSLSSIIPNLKHMPAEIVRSVPALLLGLAALVWMVVRLLRSRFGSTMSPRGREIARRDGLVGGFLALGWWGLWAVYSAYTWTAQMAGGGSFKPPAGFGSPSTMLPSAATKTATSAMNAMFAATGGRPGMRRRNSRHSFLCSSYRTHSVIGNLVGHATSPLAGTSASCARCRGGLWLVPLAHSRWRSLPYAGSWLRSIHRGRCTNVSRRRKVALWSSTRKLGRQDATVVQWRPRRRSPTRHQQWHEVGQQTVRFVAQP